MSPNRTKVAKRKSKEKGATPTGPNLDLSSIESAVKEKNTKYNKLIKLKEAQKIHMEYEILMKDMSGMADQ